MRVINGADLICNTLAGLGAGPVFGLPGTQNVDLFEALRRGPLRAVVTSDEMAATFAAGAYARASGRFGVVTTIPGPGFTYALTALAEARADSAPLVYLTLRQPDSGRCFQLQRLDQPKMAAPVVKAAFYVDRIDNLAGVVCEAAETALRGEPGPVLLEVARRLLDFPVSRSLAIECRPAMLRVSAFADAPFDDVAHGQTIARLKKARRPLLLLGQGAQGASQDLTRWCEASNTPVMTTCSGRGAISERHRLSLFRDFVYNIGAVIPEIVNESDLIVAIGCKFSHNSTAGFGLDLPQNKLVHIDSASTVLGANYPASLSFACTAEDFAARLSAAGPFATEWSRSQLAAFRERLAGERAGAVAYEPRVRGLGKPIRAFFAELNAALPDDAIFTTDSGRNQAVTRGFAEVRRARGMITPTDFQSMGFGLPAAIGAKMAAPGAEVVACIGDGGLLQTATELLTAVREHLDLTVIVFNDGCLGYIQRQQLGRFGVTSGVDLGNIDYRALADAFGCSYFDASAPDFAFDAVFAAAGVKLVDLPLGDPPSVRLVQARSRARERIRRALGPVWIRRLKGWLGR